MANYADFLSNFDFDVLHKSSKENVNADYLSRMVSTAQIREIMSVKDFVDERDGYDNFIIRQINQLPITAERIALEVRKDQQLGKIIQLLERGQCLKRAGYKSPQANYKLSSGCLTFDHRIVIPAIFHKIILNELHAAHLGMVKMKGIARSFVYWPGIDKDIENTAKECELCAKSANIPTRFRDHHWEYPKSPWERVHIDYAGPFEGTMLLVITDAYSKWLEVKITKSTTASSTIILLDEVFATYGVPLMIVSDNGTNFSSAEFNNYLTKIGVKYHKFTAPYHPATNGQAERNVQTVKNALKAMGTTSFNIRENLNEFLRQYRNAPHSTTNQSPAQLFLGRQLRTRMDLVRPEGVSSRVSTRQFLKSKSNYRLLEDNQVVYFLSGNPRTSKWLKGKVVRRLGDIHYEITYNGKLYRRHIDQIRGTEQFVKNKDGDFETNQNVRICEDTTSFTLLSNNAQIYANHSYDDNNQQSEQLSSNGQLRNDLSVLTEMSNSSTPQNKQVQNEQFTTPPTSMQSSDESLTLTASSQFKGFTESLSTPSASSKGFNEPLQTTEIETREHPLRRSSRPRKPRVLFSP